MGSTINVVDLFFLAMHSLRQSNFLLIALLVFYLLYAVVVEVVVSP